MDIKTHTKRDISRFGRMQIDCHLPHGLALCVLCFVLCVTQTCVHIDRWLRSGACSRAYIIALDAWPIGS